MMFSSGIVAENPTVILVGEELFFRKSKKYQIDTCKKLWMQKKKWLRGVKIYCIKDYLVNTEAVLKFNVHLMSSKANKKKLRM